MPKPSKGAPINSCDVFSLSDRRVVLELDLPPPWPGGALNSEPARIGDGPEIWRSSEEFEFEEAYSAGFGEVVVRV
jgi:hypothetical protein